MEKGSVFSGGSILKAEVCTEGGGVYTCGGGGSLLRGYILS